MQLEEKKMDKPTNGRLSVPNVVLILSFVLSLLVMAAGYGTLYEKVNNGCAKIEKLDAQYIELLKRSEDNKIRISQLETRVELLRK
jgi:hypothetical protein